MPPRPPPECGWIYASRRAPFAEAAVFFAAAFAEGFEVQVHLLAATNSRNAKLQARFLGIRLADAEH
jgi:hypothetical protein